MSTRFFVLDTETAGLKPEDGLVEIGWFELDEQANIVDRVQSLIDPQGPISPAASGVHNLTAEDVQDAPTAEEFFSLDDPSCYGKPIEADRIVMCGHKIAFDVGFLQPYLKGDVQQVCTLRWSRQMYPDSDSHTLSTLKYALGLRKDTGVAHRVLADVEVTYDLLLHIMQRLQCTLPELAERSQQPMLLARMSFGKHKGEPPSAVPNSYWRWMLNNLEEIDADLRFTAETYLGAK